MNTNSKFILKSGDLSADLDFPLALQEVYSWSTVPNRKYIDSKHLSDGHSVI